MSAHEALGFSVVAGRDADGRGAVRFRGALPATGDPSALEFAAATSEDIGRAADAAVDAFDLDRHRTLTERAEMLRAIAAAIGEAGDDLLITAQAETGLALPRLTGERDRTINQLRLFADRVEDGSWVDAVIDRGQPQATPAPKPDIRRMLRPLGPVAVFGASNFPLAFGVAGGDTASALAAGCPVIVKGHPAHPATGEIVARAVTAGIRRAGFHAGTFSFLHAGGSRDLAVGEELVLEPRIRAVGFTGSQKGGLALAKLAASRPRPIPVFAEMGSINPTFILEGALRADPDDLARRLAAAITGSAGQLCTKPGLLFVVDSEAAARFSTTLATELAKQPAQVMLSTHTRDLFARRLRESAHAAGVTIATGQAEQSAAAAALGSAVLLRVADDAFAADPRLAEECFGPAALIVSCLTPERLLARARGVPGSLAGAIFAGPGDDELRRALGAILAERVGRLVFNGVTTGVAVCAAMQHGGPYPATTRPDTTSVGTAAIVRWCRPIAWQDAPDALLPPELQEQNPRHIARIEDGRRVDPRGAAR